MRVDGREIEDRVVRVLWFKDPDGKIFEVILMFVGLYWVKKVIQRRMWLAQQRHQAYEDKDETRFIYFTDLFNSYVDTAVWCIPHARWRLIGYFLRMPFILATFFLDVVFFRWISMTWFPLVGFSRWSYGIYWFIYLLVAYYYAWEYFYTMMKGTKHTYTAFIASVGCITEIDDMETLTRRRMKAEKVDHLWISRVMFYAILGCGIYWHWGIFNGHLGGLKQWDYLWYVAIWLLFESFERFPRFWNFYTLAIGVLFVAVEVRKAERAADDLHYIRQQMQRNNNPWRG